MSSLSLFYFRFKTTDGNTYRNVFVFHCIDLRIILSCYKLNYMSYRNLSVPCQWYLFAMSYWHLWISPRGANLSHMLNWYVLPYNRRNHFRKLSTRNLSTGKWYELSCSLFDMSYWHLWTSPRAVQLFHMLNWYVLPYNRRNQFHKLSTRNLSTGIWYDLSCSLFDMSYWHLWTSPRADKLFHMLNWYVLPYNRCKHLRSLSTRNLSTKN
jgi:hypothetical protein